MDAHSTTERRTSHAGNKHTEQHIQSAHAAWDAWKSDDPAAWDWALDQREKISKKDPKAWSKAMKEVDAEEAAQKHAKEEREKEMQRQKEAALKAELDAEIDAEARQREAESKLRAEYLDTRTQYDLKPVEIPHPGYAPHSNFAPEAPNSPAYDAAYNRDRGEFQGLDLGIVKLGVRDGSLETGVNVGIASTEVSLGKNTGVNAEFMPYGGPLHARANANLGFEKDGIHSEVGAGANFFDLVNGDADFGASLGKNTGVSGDVRGRAWPVDVQADAGAGIGPQGFNAYTGANTGVADAFGVRSGAHFNVGENSSAAAGVGLKLDDQTLDFGPSIDTYGNRTLRPNLNLRPGHSDEATFYPTGNRDID
jgi:hypothetical protein